jgi:hypothetical protein
MKLTGKEDEVMMQLVSDWWTTELAENRCWYVLDVLERGKLLVHFNHRPAGDYHAVCSFLKHQGSKCAFPCIWCKVRDTTGKDRACSKCGRHSCAHTPFTGIHREIVAPIAVDPDCVGSEPSQFATSIDASHNLLKPRREGPATRPEKASSMQAKAVGTQQAVGGRQKRKRDTNNAESAHGSTAAEAPRSQPNALDPKLRMLAHPKVI